MFENTQPGSNPMQTPPPPTPSQQPTVPQFGNDRGAEDIFAEADHGTGQMPQGAMMSEPPLSDSGQPSTPFAEPRPGGMGRRLGIWIAVLVVIAGAGAALYFFTDIFSPTVNLNENTNVVLNTNTSVNTNTSANLNTNTANTNSGVDTDNDGLTDAEEFSLGTLINNRDSDNDGLSDYAEVKFYSTDPLNTDTDGDGYSDGTEVENGFNPNGTGTL